MEALGSISVGLVVCSPLLVGLRNYCSPLAGDSCWWHGSLVCPHRRLNLSSALSLSGSLYLSVSHSVSLRLSVCLCLSLSLPLSPPPPPSLNSTQPLPFPAALPWAWGCLGYDSSWLIIRYDIQWVSGLAGFAGCSVALVKKRCGLDVE